MGLFGKPPHMVTRNMLYMLYIRQSVFNHSNWAFPELQETSFLAFRLVRNPGHDPHNSQSFSSLSPPSCWPKINTSHHHTWLKKETPNSKPLLDAEIASDLLSPPHCCLLQDGRILRLSIAVQLHGDLTGQPVLPSAVVVLTAGKSMEI